MRKLFASVIYSQMQNNDDIWVLTADLGFGILDTIQKDFPNRFINCGAAEQALVDIGIALALSGKIVFLYSITPFLVFRPLESIRNYINKERIPVKLVGIGRDREYLIDGFTHWADDSEMIMNNFKNINCCFPNTNKELEDILRTCVNDVSPYYINLLRYDKAV